MPSTVVEITIDKLLEICRQVYESGLSGSGDLREDAIAEIMTRNNISLAENWKVYTIQELSQMPLNTVFTHSTRGRCWISQRPDEDVKFMSFSTHGPVDFRSNTEPWDKPMKLIG